jgi:hypothetical protein
MPETGAAAPGPGETEAAAPGAAETGAACKGAPALGGGDAGLETGAPDPAGEVGDVDHGGP